MDERQDATVPSVSWVSHQPELGYEQRPCPNYSPKDLPSVKPWSWILYHNPEEDFSENWAKGEMVMRIHRVSENPNRSARITTKSEPPPFLLPESFTPRHSTR